MEQVGECTLLVFTQAKSYAIAAGFYVQQPKMLRGSYLDDRTLSEYSVQNNRVCSIRSSERRLGS